MKQLPLGVRLHDRAIWASFQVAGSQQAVQGVKQLADAPATSMGWLWGAGGSGKSHLLQAVCAQLPGSGYFPLQQMLSFGPAVLEGIEALCCVCLDDVQVLAGQPDWDAALFIRRDRSPSGSFVVGRRSAGRGAALGAG